MHNVGCCYIILMRHKKIKIKKNNSIKLTINVNHLLEPKMCIATPILVTGSANGSQKVYYVSDYCQRLWRMYSSIRSESRRPDVNDTWLFCLATSCVDLNSLRNIRYPAEWTGVNVPVVFRMKIKVSKSRLSLLISGIICLNLLKNKIFKIKIWSLASENTWKI